VIELVEAAGMESDVVIMSLKAEGIQKVKSLRPSWTVGLLTAVAAGDLTRAKADFLAVNVGLANKSFIRSAHRRGKDVFVWTVNDKVTMSTMIGRGVDGLITDDPALARSVLAERAEMSPVERLLLELSLFLGAAPKAPADRGDLTDVCQLAAKFEIARKGA
jgi:glycerophosphoryl diester phosphodiesterase